MCNLSENIEANGIEKGIRKERSGIYRSGKDYVYKCIDAVN